MFCRTAIASSFMHANASISGEINGNILTGCEMKVIVKMIDEEEPLLVLDMGIFTNLSI